MFTRRMPLKCQRLVAAATQLGQGDVAAAHAILDEVKSNQTAVQGADYIRAQAFLLQHDPFAARQAVLEELRHFPDSVDARELAVRIQANLEQWLALPDDIAAAEPIFAMCYDGIRNHSMLTWPRLLQLFKSVEDVCARRVEGDIVECGSAGGGSALLMALALRHFSNGSQSRTIFACDTFTGMPPAGRNDIMLTSATPANASHWATGTCSSSPRHLQTLCDQFGIDNVKPVVGLFEDTLTKLAVSRVALLHVDADWYDSTKTVISTLLPKVCAGGVVQIDDYGYWGGCKQAVDELLTIEQRASLRDIDGNAATLIL